jgi:hypothetical protein
MLHDVRHTYATTSLDAAVGPKRGSARRPDRQSRPPYKPPLYTPGLRRYCGDGPFRHAFGPLMELGEPGGVGVTDGVVALSKARNGGQAKLSTMRITQSA